MAEPGAPNACNGTGATQLTDAKIAGASYVELVAQYTSVSIRCSCVMPRGSTLMNARKLKGWVHS